MQAAPTYALRRSIHDARSFGTSAVALSISDAGTQKLTWQKAQYEADLAKGKTFLVERGYDIESMHITPVVWGHHDAFRHVNNVHYLRWFESGRMDFAAKLAEKLSQERAQDIIQGTGKSFILAGANIRYRRPVVYPDTIIIAQSILLPIAPSRDRFMLRGAAYSLKQKTIVCTCDQDCVSYDYNTLKKVPLEDDLYDLLQGKGMYDTVAMLKQ
ncbi:Thioesterase/thiol ester dehydrase-isomerase [Tilletiaria anomala UBC 951]|uniref:Thioesterase/thiol ester dehydrase-isomerase n=1 Tax=Tilletiaria anomala (strain ATCC 24038 / CBS 436.72 / UBC 951) TaxID=1037660 RepID=A0A066V906_TILAU|nr:Thioesterase/thiol ester dehydrase-isomerase [Tilletiaria anomala UBC 951]KDN37941.1 Thioesterase/thiol ester dehydrase-isomerase [Tilletiaria anomala UBC 951]